MVLLIDASGRVKKSMWGLKRYLNSFLIMMKAVA